MLDAPSPVQRDIVQSASAPRLYFVELGDNSFYQKALVRSRYGIKLHECNLKTETFISRSRIEAPATVVYAWHVLPDALERLTPPGEHVKIIEKAGGVESGGRIVLQFGRWPFRRRWVAEHLDYEEGHYFSDVQVSGPFAYWKHTHTFEADGPSACFLEDRVEYALPFGILGRVIAGWYVRRKLAKLFEYRHNTTRQCVLNSFAAKF